MPTEIERRFLVRAGALPEPRRRADRYTQGYLCFCPTVRVRLIRHVCGREQARLTIKSGRGAVRAEFEYPIPVQDARELLALCGDFVILKERARLGRWELDRYLGRHEGLWLAEYEMKSVRERLPDPPPPWLGREVTDDPRYTNAALARLKRLPRWLGR